MSQCLHFPEECKADIDSTLAYNGHMQPSSDSHSLPNKPVAIIGAGPAGLMAAEVIASAGYPVQVFDAMPSAARKFLLAGVGGMNITHAEDWPLFISRYGERQAELQPILEAFNPEALRKWIHGLGIDTFVGSSGRVFPSDMKAAPLLRAWLHRLRGLGVQFHMRHRWLGWQGDALLFATPDGEKAVCSSATMLAMGGGSWPRLGSDGSWQTLLAALGITVKTLTPSNCGFDVKWTNFLQQHHAGSPVKNAVLSFTDKLGKRWHKRGEFIISAYGIEGSAVYALSAPLRDSLLAGHPTTLLVDLQPERSQEQIQAVLEQSRKGMSLGNVLRKKLHLTAVEVALLHEQLGKTTLDKPQALAQAIKALPITLQSPRPIAEAISSGGGISFDELTQELMLKQLPGVFGAGEMLDWEAPTGGYLLTACFATGRQAGAGVVQWLKPEQAIQKL